MAKIPDIPKKRLPVNLDKIDLDAVYRCSMVRSDSKYPNEVSDIIDVKIEVHPYGLGYDIVPMVDGYDRKFFYDLYIDFLFYTGYITKVE